MTFVAISILKILTRPGKEHNGDTDPNKPDDPLLVKPQLSVHLALL